jgi:hypothetical protein
MYNKKGGENTADRKNKRKRWSETVHSREMN